MSKVHEIVTDLIVAKLKEGKIPWRKPWITESPKNAISKKAYNGINNFLLDVQGYQNPYWLSFKQAQQLGGSVKKGEKSTPIVFYTSYDKKEKDEKGKNARYLVARYYSGFNIDQCEFSDDSKGAKLKILPQLKQKDPLESCESMIATMQGKIPTIESGSNRACYKPKSDVISMPAVQSFESIETFYSVQFHEITHSTGHKDRLARKGIVEFDGFGSHQYSYEELIAECGSAILCQKAGILNVTLENSAAYIQSWIQKLKNEPTWIMKAASEAAKSAKFLGFADDTEETETEEIEAA